MIINGKNALSDPSDGMPRVERDLTIVIPAFRCARFLPAAIESALHSGPAQVLVAMDGGGLDEPRVAERYQRDDPGRVRVLYHRRRRGVARNLNHAVEYVTTPYFAKLDGDDVLIPGHLQAALRLFAGRTSLGIVAGHDRRIAPDDHLTFVPGAFVNYLPDPAPKVLSGTEAFRFIVTWTPNPCSSGCIYRTEAFRQAGGFDPSMHWGEDWEIWLRLAQHWDVGYCDAPSALYRIHPQSTSSNQARQSRLCFGYDTVYRRAASLCRDPEIVAMLRRSFVRVAGMYAKAALRRSAHLQVDGLLCAQRAVRALASAAAPPRGEPGLPAPQPARIQASVEAGRGATAVRS